MIHIVRGVRGAVVFGIAAVVLTGCCSVADADASGKTAVCQECFDAVNRARSDHPASGPQHNETLRTYDCPCCKTEMSVYVERGVHKVRCGGCAVDGVAWDRCEPSEHVAGQRP